ncbi:MAG: hypothetical protein ACE5OY_03085 [Candidatus Bathyarchaeia archaeon]
MTYGAIPLSGRVVKRDSSSRIRLVVFDLDGTLTTIRSIWRLIHDELGTWDKAREFRERFTIISAGLSILATRIREELGSPTKSLSGMEN